MYAQGPVKGAAIDAASAGDNTLVDAVTEKKIRIISLFLVTDGAVAIRFEDGASGTALSGVMSLGANGIVVLPEAPNGWLETSAATLLNMELGGAVQVSGALRYQEID